MSRAWAIFRNTYGYPTVLFRSIGRQCFAWALRKAWWEVREARALAVMPAERLSARVSYLRDEIELLSFRSFATNAGAARRKLEVELSALAAELDRRAASLPISLQLAA
jgi:hypothetical protein